MSEPGKIRKLDDTLVNRIAAGEVIQRPANALKELIENSLDAKATNIQIVAKEGGLKLLQIQDNGTGIRKEDMEIVCERFTTSKLQTFDDLRSISTYGFRGEALASISHIALLTITTKTADEKCAYKTSYVDSKPKGPLKSCAGNQGTTIVIENLFYNVATRRKAFTNSTNEEFYKIMDVVTKYAIHNPSVGFVLKKHGEVTPQVRTPHNSTKMTNIRLLYGNAVFRELLEVEYTDETYKFKMHALITNPNYTKKKMDFLLFINNRLVDSSLIRKMLEELYTFYLPKKTHPWCYISLEIEPQNIDVNVHPTKHEVRFLHESSIIDRMKDALDEKLSAHGASRTFYVQARLPNADITQDALKEVLPEYEKKNADKSMKIRPHEMIRTDSSDQKLDKFNFTIQPAMKDSHKSENEKSNESVNKSTLSKSELNESVSNEEINNSKISTSENTNCMEKVDEMEYSTDAVEEDGNISPPLNITEEKSLAISWSNIVDDTTPSESSEYTDPSMCNFVSSTQIEQEKKTPTLNNIEDILDLTKEYEDSITDDSAKNKCIDEIADKARKQVLQRFKSTVVEGEKVAEKSHTNKGETSTDNIASNLDKPNENENTNECILEQITDNIGESSTTSREFKSYSINSFWREVKLTSVLRLRKEVEDNCHEGLREILSNLTFVGCVDDSTALIQSGLNLYICNTKKLAEELFYEIMLYDFANYGILKFSDALPLQDLAMLGLNSEEAGWTEDDGPKEELATSVKELLLEKADLLKEYFSIVVDKNGNLKSLPVLLEKYFPYEAGLPLFILRLATEVEWKTEQSCFRTICRETAKYYSQMNPVHDTHDWKYIAEHVLYSAIKKSLLPPKHFAHDSTILQIASLPALYKIFERC